MEEGVADFGHGAGDGDAGAFQRGDFIFGAAFASGDDGACVSHATSGRGGCARDECRHWFFDVFFHKCGGFFFLGASDFADHDNRLGLRVVVEKFDDLPMRESMNGVAADADASALSVITRGNLPNGFVGEGAASRNNADGTGLVNISGHDADFALPGRDDAGAVGPDEKRIFYA